MPRYRRVPSCPVYVALIVPRHLGWVERKRPVSLPDGTLVRSDDPAGLDELKSFIGLSNDHRENGEERRLVGQRRTHMREAAENETARRG